MRTIEWATQFKRDFKREQKGQLRATLDDALFPVVDGWLVIRGLRRVSVIMA